MKSSLRDHLPDLSVMATGGVKQFELASSNQESAAYSRSARTSSAVAVGCMTLLASALRMTTLEIFWVPFLFLGPAGFLAACVLLSWGPVS
jgi:hypothetical protein